LWCAHDIRFRGWRLHRNEAGYILLEITSHTHKKARLKRKQIQVSSMFEETARRAVCAALRAICVCGHARAIHHESR
jgi:hypothetical protein